MNSNPEYTLPGGTSPGAVEVKIEVDTDDIGGETDIDIDMPRGWERLRPFEQLLLDDNLGRNTPLITAIFRLDATLTKDWVVRHVATPLATHPRFRSIIPTTARAPKRFVLCDTFDPDNHVTVEDRPLVPDVLDELLSTSLPQVQPLWHLYVFSDGNMVMRLHHVIGDGIGLIEFCMRAISTPGSKKDVIGDEEKLGERKPMHKTLVANNALPTTLDKLVRPFSSVYSTLIKILIHDTGSVFTSEGGRLTPMKHCGWSREYSVIYLRNICRRLGITLNDLLLAVVSGTVRRYTETVETPRPKRMWLGVPFNGHSTPDLENDENVVYNALVVLLLPLAINESTILKRLARTCRTTNNTKAGYGIPLAIMAFKAMELLPASVRIRLWRYVTKSISLVFTNVPGPEKSVYINDKEILEMKTLSPAQGSCPLTVSAFSYADKLNIGVVVDKNRLQYPQKFMDIFDEEMEAVLSWIKRLES